MENENDPAIEALEGGALPAQQPTTVSGGDKPEQKVLSFTQDALNAMDAKAKNAGKRSIMKQFGVSDEKDMPSVVAKFNAYLEAKKNKETDGNKLRNLSDQHSKLSGDYAAALAELSGYKQKEILRKHGVTDDEQIEFLGYKIGKLTTDDKDFEQTAANYFKEHPAKKDEPAKPEFIPRTPPAKIGGKTEIDPVMAAFMKGAGIKNKE